MSINFDLLKGAKKALIALVILMLVVPMMLYGEGFDYSLACESGTTSGSFSTLFFLWPWGNYSLLTGYSFLGASFMQPVPNCYGNTVHFYYPNLQNVTFTMLPLAAVILIVSLIAIPAINSEASNARGKSIAAGVISMVMGVIMVMYSSLYFTSYTLGDGGYVVALPFPFPSPSGILAIIVGLAVLIIAARSVERVAKEKHQKIKQKSSSGDDALRILREKLAQGEISEDEFLKKKSILEY